MARPLRLEFPGAVYHLTARGDRQEPIFEGDDDRVAFVELLAKEIRQQGWLLYAFCLMGNHYHLLLETPEPNLVRGMRRLNGVYTQAFNHRHDRAGHVLQGRYKAILVDKDSHLLELCRYVVLNPVRAQMVAAVGEWPWSSYLATAGKMACPDWLAAEQVLGLFSSSDRAQARRAYSRFVAEGVDGPSPWSQLKGQIFSRTESFIGRWRSCWPQPSRSRGDSCHRQADHTGGPEGGGQCTDPGTAGFDRNSDPFRHPVPHRADLSLLVAGIGESIDGMAGPEPD